jgi:hypothetical protein
MRRKKRRRRKTHLKREEVLRHPSSSDLVSEEVDQVRRDLLRVLRFGGVDTGVLRELIRKQGRERSQETSRRGKVKEGRMGGVSSNFASLG